jgi:hypothetical protein
MPCREIQDEVRSRADLFLCGHLDLRLEPIDSQGNPLWESRVAAGSTIPYQRICILTAGYLSRRAFGNPLGPTESGTSEPGQIGFESKDRILDTES